MALAINKKARIYIAGHRGMAGSAIARCLAGAGYRRLLTCSRADLDLTDQSAVAAFFKQEQPQYVFLAAAKVGGIHANNSYPADFIYSNLMIQSNVIHQSYLHDVKRLLFLGSSCIYPKNCPQPMQEKLLLSGHLEPTNEPYAVAKIAGIKMCTAYNRQYRTCFVSVMPTNLYGPNDNFDLESSHVLPAFIRKFHLAKLAHVGDWGAIDKDEQIFGPIPPALKAALGINTRTRTDAGIILWGSGKPKREFLHVDDLARAAVQVMHLEPAALFPPGRDSAHPQWLNIGYGDDLSIKDLARLVADVIGYRGKVVWDASMPDGTPRKLLDVTRIKALGWQPAMKLEDGIRQVYKWYVRQLADDA